MLRVSMHLIFKFQVEVSDYMIRVGEKHFAVQVKEEEHMGAVLHKVIVTILEKWIRHIKLAVIFALTCFKEVMARLIRKAMYGTTTTLGCVY